MKAKQDTILYSPTTVIEVEADIEGIAYSNVDGFTIVPRVVQIGTNRVVALRHEKLVRINAGDVIGVIVSTEQPEEKELSLDDMNVPQLKSYAKKNGVDIGEARTKPEVLAAIASHLGY